MSFFKKTQAPMLAFIFMLITASLYGWIWLMVEQQGIDLKNQVQTIADQKDFEEHYQKIISTIEDTESERKALENYVLQDDSQTISLLSQFDKIAADQQVMLGTKELVVEETSGNFNKLKLGYHIEGSEASVIKMLELFETLPYHGMIAGVDIDRTLDEDGLLSSATALISLEQTIKKYDR
jgi:hypothetical protein